ncbi:hypothetical protein KAR28_01165 [Candidatus Parcubacteria bacterium]|nr:hypothetical protein [Candidatus Parcubacteria bacterium]
MEEIEITGHAVKVYAVKENGVTWHYNGSELEVAYPKVRTVPARIQEILPGWAEGVEEKYRTKVIDYDIEYDGTNSRVIAVIALTALADIKALTQEDWLSLFKNAKEFFNMVFFRDNPLPCYF